MNKTNEALNAEKKFRTSVEEAQEYIENFDILETINNVGNDEVFTPVNVCQQILDLLPPEVWSNPDLKWLNPFDKNGVFLREIALRLDLGLIKWESDVEKRRKHILQNMIFSIGLTKFTSQVSRRTVYYCSHANRSFDGNVDQDGNSINGYAIGNGQWFDTEQGNILTPITDHSFKKGKCIYCGTFEKNKDGTPGKYADSKQLEHYAYEFIHVDDLEKHLQKRFFGGKKMKFDIIIGNPPYQISDGGGTGDSAKPIYQLFIQQAKMLKPNHIVMIIPSRWMKGGKGLDSFREEMISDTHLRVLHDYEDAKEIFPGFNIDGGVCYFDWDIEYNGKVDYFTHKLGGEETIHSKRYLKSKGSNKIIRDPRQLSIVEKTHNFDKFSSIVMARNPYGFSSDFFNRPKNYGFDSIPLNPTNNSVRIFGIIGKKGGAKRIIGFIDRDLVTLNTSEIDKYKLFFSKAYMTTSTIPPEIIIGEPGDICTETFLQIGSFATKNEALSCLSYIKTKFFRALLFFNRHSLNISRESFDLIPLKIFNQTFKDNDLYKEFNLSDESVEYIELTIKDME